MHSLTLWIEGTRPKTWIASISPICLATIEAAFEGRFDLILFFSIVLSALSIQIGTNLANDYFDCIHGADTKERKGPLRLAGSGLVPLAHVRWGFLIAFSLALLLGSYFIYTGGLFFAGLLILSIFLGIAYTGGPYPLAYRGWGDLFVFLFFGPIATGSTYYLFTGTLTLEPLLSGIGCGLLSTAILVMNNLRDEEEDRKVQKNTLVVRFGKGFGKGEFLTCILGAALLPICFSKTHPFVGISSSILLPATPLCLALFQKSPSYRELFPKTARLLVLYTLLWSIGWMF